MRGADGEAEAPDGVATWVPIVRDLVRRQHRRVTIERKLCPRYLFFGYGRGAVPWLDVREAMGVHGVICVGTPARIRAKVVGELISRVERGDFAMSDRPPVQRGMRVVGERGALNGFKGDAMTLDKERWVAGVLFDKFGRTVPAKDLAPRVAPATQACADCCRRLSIRTT